MTHGPLAINQDESWHEDLDQIINEAGSAGARSVACTFLCTRAGLDFIAKPILSHVPNWSHKLEAAAQARLRSNMGVLDIFRTASILADPC